MYYLIINLCTFCHFIHRKLGRWARSVVAGAHYLYTRQLEIQHPTSKMKLVLFTSYYNILSLERTN